MQRASFRHTAWALLALGAIFAPLVRAHDPKCGDEVGTPGSSVPLTLTLSDNIGPCAGDGLILRAQYITINLNGRKIFAAPGNTGTGIRSDYPINTVITGPGGVEGFGTGIKLDHQRTATIQSVTFTSNTQFGIYVVQSGGSGDIHIRQNTFDHGGTGIRVAESGNVKVKENTINWQSVAGITASDTVRATFILNTFWANQVGMIVTSGVAGTSELKVALNRFWVNFTHGLQLNGRFGRAEIVSNTSASNGQNGFDLPSPVLTFPGSKFEDNVATQNGRYGFSLAGEVKMIENRGASNAAADLLFATPAPLPPGACFKYNQFGTTTPAVLPACP